MTFQCCRHYRICRSKDHIRREPYDFLRHAVHSLLAFTAEPVVEPDVMALCPAEILQSLPEGRKIGLPNLVVLREAHNDADTPHSIALLGARRELPDGRTAKYANEDAPAHRAVPPKNCLSNDANYSVHFPSGESNKVPKMEKTLCHSMSEMGQTEKNSA